MTLAGKLTFNRIKKTSLTLTIEHAPCCLLSFGAGFIGIPFMYHNPVLELGFAMGGAMAGEYIGHKYLCRPANEQPFSKKHSIVRRYGLSLIFGVASWGAHQVLFHDHGHEHAHHDNNGHQDHTHAEKSANMPPVLRRALEMKKELEKQKSLPQPK